MRDNIKLYLQRITKKSSLEGGFTMTDLMVAAAVTTVVVSTAGIGVATMVDASNTSTAKSERRVEMNRGLDFITTEIRRAENITKDVATAATPANFSPSSDQIDTSTIEKVLMIKIAELDSPIIYYSAKPLGGKWTGPKVIYRWGPQFDENGNYYQITGSANWKHDALIDKIGTPSSNTSIGSGAGACPDSTWTRNGTSKDFYSCVDPNGKVAQIFTVGNIKKLLGTGETYALNTQTGARGINVPSTIASLSDGTTFAALPTVGSSGSPSSSPSPSTPPLVVLPPAFEVVSGDPKTVSTSTMTVRYLGGEITCGAGGAKIPTSGTIKLTGGTSQSQALGAVNADVTFNDVAANTTLNLTGVAGTGSRSFCGGHYMTANTKTSQGSQVLTLVDGDTVPLFTPFGGQRTVDSFLTSTSTNPLTGLPIINTTTGKISLAKNQVIYLFELGTTSKSSAAYDMQDMVVLATITPTTTTNQSYSGSSVSSAKCNNGLGNGSEGCTPGKARPNDEIVVNSSGTVICTPAPGNPCTQAAKTSSNKKK
jgi:hypothetical protein